MKMQWSVGDFNGISEENLSAYVYEIIHSKNEKHQPGHLQWPSVVMASISYTKIDLGEFPCNFPFQFPLNSNAWPCVKTVSKPSFSTSLGRPLSVKTD